MANVKEFRDAEFRITPHPEKNDKKKGVYIVMDYEFLYRNVIQDDGTVCIYLPIFEVYFYASSMDEGDAISQLVFNTYIDGWMKDEGFGGFIRHLKVIGFEPTGGVLDWNNLKKRKLTQPIVFKPTRAKISIPEDFGGAKVEERRMTNKFALAY